MTPIALTPEQIERRDRAAAELTAVEEVLIKALAELEPLVTEVNAKRAAAAQILQEIAAHLDAAISERTATWCDSMAAEPAKELALAYQRAAEECLGTRYSPVYGVVDHPVVFVYTPLGARIVAEEPSLPKQIRRPSKRRTT